MSEPTTKKQSCKAFKGRISVSIDVPTSVELYDEWSGKPGDALSDAISNHIAHSYLGVVRDVVADALNKKGGAYARKTEKKNDKDVFSETGEKYVARLVAEGVLSDAELQELASQVLTNESITFQSTLASTGKRGKLGQEYLDGAQGIIEAWEKGVNDSGAPTSIEKTLGILRGRLPGINITDPTNVEELAYILRDYERAAPKAVLV